jgi:ketosteroid isomerase-like protein
VTVEISELSARAEISDLMARYARGVDRGDWTAVRACYHPDAHDDHGAYKGGIDGLMDHLEQLAGMLTATTHELGNHLVEIDGDAARAETYCTGWYRRTDRHGHERLIAQGLRYLDRFERRAGRWAIAHRTVVLDWEHVFDPGRQAPIGPEWCRGGRGAADPSHAHFAARR